MFFGKAYIRRKCDRRDKIHFHRPFLPSTFDEPTPPRQISKGGWGGWGGCDLTGLRKS